MARCSALHLTHHAPPPLDTKNSASGWSPASAQTLKSSHVLHHFPVNTMLRPGLNIRVAADDHVTCDGAMSQIIVHVQQ
jgi:hypothetical protein